MQNRFHKLLNNQQHLFWVLQITGWAGFAVLKYFTAISQGIAGDYWILVSVFAISGLVLTLGMRQIYRQLWNRPLWLLGIGIVVVSVGSAMIWESIRIYAWSTFYGECEECGRFLFAVFKYGVSAFYVLLAWSGLYFGIKYYRMLQRQRVMTLRARSMAHESQLKMLRYQLNPHFLFNTLNAISTLVLEKELALADSMIGKLSKFLRQSLDGDPMQQVTLEQELEAITLYLDIENVRFADRLQVRWEVDEAVQSALVPSLILQPLIENAIKYAITPSETGGTIRIGAAAKGGRLILEVGDDGPGANLEAGRLVETSGVGVQNIRQRLGAIYGESCTFMLENVQPHGLLARISIPLEMSHAKTFEPAPPKR